MSSAAHPPDGELRALLDGELPAVHRAAGQQHVAACPACAARFTEIEQAAAAAGSLLNLLVPPVPALQLNAVLYRARRARVQRAGLIAAGLTLLVAASAGATVGRPYVRALAARIWAAVHSRTAVPVHNEPPPSAETGVAVVPGMVAEIVFDTAQASGALRVSLADTAELAIRSSEPVTYRVYPVGVIVRNRGSSASYEIVIPQAAPKVRIVVAGRVVLEKVGSRIVTAAAADSAGRFVMNVR